MSNATEVGQESLVTPAHLRQYKEEGYTLVRGLIPPADLEAPARELLKIESGDHNWPEEYHHWADPAKVLNPKGGKLSGGVQLPAKLSEDFRKIADHPNLQAAMAGLLGGPVKRFTDQAAVKSRYVTTEQRSMSFFHQDSYYWHIAPELGCNCWIPFQDVDKEAIALAVMPRSHLGWTLTEHEQYFDDPAYFGGRSTEPFKRLRIPLDKVDFSKEVLIPMRAGDGLFFTNYTWHRSEKNLTGRSMMFYAIAYQRADK